jgi:hypothetical protein
MWLVEAATNAIAEPADHLACEQVELVVIEVTCVYWRRARSYSRSAGLRHRLVSTPDARNVSGRPKTDEHDEIRLAKLADREMPAHRI